MPKALVISTCALAVASEAFGADITPPASERFEDSLGEEVPDFQKHVVPLIGRSGCSARDCHGSFQGQGGFRLSLFGYDFAADHEAITKGIGDSEQQRVDPNVPEESLLLKKPTRTVAHEGGKKFAPDSWQYLLLRRWIEGGAQGTQEKARLSKLEVLPAEITFSPSAAVVPLRVIARWEDGTSEDITCLSRFQSNNEGYIRYSQRAFIT